MHLEQREHLEQPERLVRLEQRERPRRHRRREHLGSLEQLEHLAHPEQREQRERRERLRQHQKNSRCGILGYILAKRIYPKSTKGGADCEIKAPYICTVHQNISLTDKSKEEVPMQTIGTHCIR